MGKTKKLRADAKPVSVSLTPEEEMALQTIMSRRRKKERKDYSRGEVISDAIWFYLENVEHVKREKIEELVPAPPEKEKKTNVTIFKKKPDKMEE